MSGEVNGGDNIGGLIGDGYSDTRINASYWDIQASGRNTDGINGSQGYRSGVLRSPTDYTSIYSTWDDYSSAESNHQIWCDEDSSGMIEANERRDNNRVWDFGTSNGYPALRCTGDSLASQRAWWYLNTTSHKPQLNRTRVKAYLDGSLP